MVVAKRKSLEEIKESVSGYKKVLNTGCGGCVSACLAGGQAEVNKLNAELNALFKKENIPCRVDGFTVERQCEEQFLAPLDDLVKDCDCILSMACGAGVQFLAERYPDKPVFPAVNTVFIGVDKGPGWYEEKCRSCGDCQLAYTGGICPVTRCAKSIFNGPCGGTSGEFCELEKNISCAWYAIYQRLKEQGRLENILEVKPPVKWQNQIQGAVIQPGYEDRYK